MFEKLLSNNRMKAELSAAIINDKPMQAYLFCGAQGSGKKTAALALARELVGVNPQKAERLTHPDVIFIRPPDGKKQISVEQIRNMRADSFIKPSEGIRKVYIIDGVQFMNDAGQNALLTVLEQPPSFAVFILLTQARARVLPTVLSRCAVFDMEYVDIADGERFLKNLHPEADASVLQRAMRVAQGNLGLALQLAQTGQFENRVRLGADVCLAAADRNEYEVSRLIGIVTKDEMTEFLSVLTMVLRDIAVLFCAQDSDILVFGDLVLQNREKFAKMDINVLYNSITACENAIELIAGNVSYSLAAAGVVIALCGGKQID